MFQGNFQKPGKKPASSLPERIEDCEPEFLQLMNMKLCPHNDDRFEKGTGELFKVLKEKCGDQHPSPKEAV